MRPILRSLAVGLSLFAGGLVGTVAVAEQPVVVELFTSQGCSSCPPADALLGELADRDGVIALAFHVDYWDYLGWEDTFAKPAYTQRQRGYAPKVDRSFIGRRLRGSFTPEIVVQGSDSLIGSRRGQVEDRIAAHAAQAPRASVTLERVGDEILVRLAPVSGTSPAARVMLAQYRPQSTVGVERGENAGRNLVYHNVVHDLQAVGRWDGQSEQELRLRGTEGPIAVFLQRGESGAILAAAKLE